jgi:hypothetical protein
MRVIIEIEKDDELQKIKKALEGENITIVKTQKEREKVLEDIFNKYNITLPKNYKFDREEIHAR